MFIPFQTSFYNDLVFYIFLQRTRLEKGRRKGGREEKSSTKKKKQKTFIYYASVVRQIRMKNIIKQQKIP